MHKIKMLIILLSGLIFLSACMPVTPAPTVTPTITSTSTPTGTPSPTPTLTPTPDYSVDQAKLHNVPPSMAELKANLENKYVKCPYDPGAEPDKYKDWIKNKFIPAIGGDPLNREINIKGSIGSGGETVYIQSNPHAPLSNQGIFFFYEDQITGEIHPVFVVGVSDPGGAFYATVAVVLFDGMGNAQGIDETLQAIAEGRVFDGGQVILTENVNLVDSYANRLAASGATFYDQEDRFVFGAGGFFTVNN